ncbi:class I mannose-6-phosphate isomerase [Psychroflexus sp. CAK57W]|uniref:type I phosphomannose isomerase catalytic subunit n=1 Tax=Psychroflexus curvus TaxID=2873595 RepID=UPI001CCFE29F|nr:type I phosphomannose isomerase catalytic subunit [Psychroflexus curvus]MBZ9627756.1 class I mannose-6-phosphate isomerase [Psychroflexus curvus]MBZ9787433.1 class I mannose-6-phosphate isomerase [Psychroflexus curvus]
MLYPLKFNSILKEKIWGGNKLYFKTEEKIHDKKIGESWEISGIKNEVSVIKNGSLRGKSLQDILEEFEDKLVGKSVFERFNYEFPVLIKLIEAKENLSVQLHPDDRLAKKRHNSFGKTEMWYILEAEEDSRLIIDFNESITVERYQELLKKGDLEAALNTVKVKEGDAFFIKPGLVHAIGAGITLAEIQQTSDITYRLFDWNRTDKEGNPRQLHTDLALDAINFDSHNDYKIQYHPKLNSKVSLASTPYFITNYLKVKGGLDLNYSNLDSFTILMNVGHEDAFIVHEKLNYTISSKETLLIPACLDFIRLESKGTKLLEISI